MLSSFPDKKWLYRRLNIFLPIFPNHSCMVPKGQIHPQNAGPKINADKNTMIINTKDDWWIFWVNVPIVENWYKLTTPPNGQMECKEALDKKGIPTPDSTRLWFMAIIAINAKKKIWTILRTQRFLERKKRLIGFLNMMKTSPRNDFQEFNGSIWRLSKILLKIM